MPKESLPRHNPPANECNSFFDLYRGGLETRDVIDRFGTKLYIPRKHLFGTQERGGYLSSKRKVVEERLKKCGYHCLEENPPLVCALFGQESAIIAATDGHHRIRYSSPIIGHGPLPVHALELSEMSKLLSEAEERVITPGELKREILEDIYGALSSFRNMPYSKIPIPITGASGMEDLVSMFGKPNSDTNLTCADIILPNEKGTITSILPRV